MDAWGADSTTVVETTYTTTFTQANGVITFAAPVSLWTINASIDNVTEVYIIPGLFTTGIALGVDNIDVAKASYQTKLQNWIKQ